MRKAIGNLENVLVLTRVSKTIMPVRTPAGMVFGDRLAVFATDSDCGLGVLSSSPHVLWAIARGTTRTGDPTYAPTTVYETFPQPAETDAVRILGQRLNAERIAIMTRREIGLTPLYDMINDPETSEADDDVARLREIHASLDLSLIHI